MPAMTGQVSASLYVTNAWKGMPGRMMASQERTGVDATHLVGDVLAVVVETVSARYCPGMSNEAYVLFQL